MTKDNILAREPINKLIAKFAIPAIISTLVGALYNMVDQVFVGRGVGIVGNAATNVSFPLTTIFIAISLLFGVGTAANFNLRMGEGRKEEAESYIGNGLVLIALTSIIAAIVAFIFLEPLLRVFGAGEEVMPYAMEYARIIVIGFPFLAFNTASSHIIRADGNPNFAMICVLAGALINTILDPIFIFVFKWGMAGAAWATIIGQIISFLMGLYYLIYKFETFKIVKDMLRIERKPSLGIISLGASASFNQVALLIMQITLNNGLSHYGSLSKYGSVIPLSVAGIIGKVNFIFLSISIGVGQGCQPIFGFNYGAKNFQRVKETMIRAAKINLMVGLLAFLCFQIFPRQIISFFGQGNELYYEFGIKFFRIYMFFTLLNGLLPLIGNYFASIGKPVKGIFMTSTRQFLFLVPLLIILPKFFGINGIVYAGPLADFASFVTAVLLIASEFRYMEV